MAKKKPTTTLKYSIEGMTATFEMQCPACLVIVPANTEHSCKGVIAIQK